MRPLLTLALLAFATLALPAGPKIATVKVSEVRENFDRARKEEAAFEKAYKELLENPRRKAAFEMKEKLDQLTKELQGLEDRNNRRALIQDRVEKAQLSFEDLRQKWTQYRTTEYRKLVEKQVDLAKQRNAEIMKAASKIADEEGFDWLIETEGQTDSKMPVVLYIRESTDLTEKIIDRLNAPEAEEGEEAPSEEPEKATDPE